LLPNGKLDRRALPRPDAASPNHERRRDEREAPRTDAEKAVAEVWQGLLGVQHIGRSDNFFDLGGHSLLAMRAVNELEKRLGTKLDLRTLVFESLAQVAAAVDGSVVPDGEPAPQRSSLFGRLLDGIGLGRSGAAS
jgi:acyl carrier protein